MYLQCKHWRFTMHLTVCITPPSTAVQECLRPGNSVHILLLSGRKGQVQCDFLKNPLYLWPVSKSSGFVTVVYFAIHKKKTGCPVFGNLFIFLHVFSRGLVALSFSILKGQVFRTASSTCFLRAYLDRSPDLFSEKAELLAQCEKQNKQKKVYWFCCRSDLETL